ncbi:MAG TPA: hypothetical protein P5346_09685 [Spirochaetota bacterium]|nr:hypothetical protein [Spirochaetota bacterium]HSA14997.1 hypothetical protein [Spirochaetota bacterium]
MIKEIQRAAAAGQNYYFPVRCKVQSVDETNYMITAIKVEDESESAAPVYDAYLRASTVGGLGVILVPEKDSIVVIAFPGNKNEQAVVIQYSKIEKIIFNVKTSIEFKIDGADASVLTIDSNGIVQGKSDSAEPALLGDKMKTWAKKVDQALNAIVQWGATGVAGTGGTSDSGGISPLGGVELPSFDDATLSETNKVS